MSADPSAPDVAREEELPLFSPMRGGPLYRLLLRTRLCGPELEWPIRRVVLVAALAWLPLLLFSAHTRVSGGIDFLHDIDAHVRFLVAVPLLIAGELAAHRRFKAAVRQFVIRGIVIPKDRGRYAAAVASGWRVADSLALDFGVLLFVLTVGHWVWLNQVALDTASWYGIPGAGGLRLTVAGQWYAWVSVPIAQFVMIRWLARLAVWYLFLWRTSRLDLRLTATHPDECGGLGFVGNSILAFGPFLAAQGVLFAGIIAGRIFYEGRTLESYKTEVAGLVLLLLTIVLAPLSMFTPLLARTKREGLRAYGALAGRYVQEFDAKWVGGGAPPGEPLVGSADVQSLADMANSFAVVKGMNLVPFSWRNVANLAVVIVAPMVPIMLTVFPIDEVIDQVLKLLL